MCVTAVVLAAAALASAAVGTGLSIKSAADNAAAQQDQLQLQREEAVADMQAKRLQAAQAEAARLGDFRRTRAANIAAIAGSGVRENLSYLQGILPEEEKALALDLGNIRMGLTGEENRMASQIRVNRLAGRVASYNKGMKIAGSLVDLAGQAASIGNYYETYRPGSSGLKATSSFMRGVPDITSLPTRVPGSLIGGY